MNGFFQEKTRRTFVQQWSEWILQAQKNATQIIRIDWGQFPERCPLNPCQEWGATTRYVWSFANAPTLHKSYVWNVVCVANNHDIKAEDQVMAHI